MSNANATAPAPSASIGGALLVSNDEVTIKQLRESMQQLAMFPEVCADVPAALGVLHQRKFDAVIVDLQLGGQAKEVVEKVRLSPSNRTAVIFTISESDAETASAFKAGSNFVLRRPLSLAAIDRSLKVAYGLIVRERRRYFRCPLEIPVTICRPAMPAVHAQAVNISEGGIAIVAPVSLGTGVQVQVQFTLPGRESRFAVESTACWSKEAYLGLQFNSLSAELSSELQEWLSRRLEESLPQFVADKFQNLENAPHATKEPPEDSKSSVGEPPQNLNEMDPQNWVVLYRAALLEPDVEKRLPTIELAERILEQRWRELAAAGSEDTEERRRLSDSLKNLRGLKAGSR